MASLEDNRMVEMNDIEISTLSSPWRNVYWFARMLISSDKYGAVGKDGKLMVSLTSKLRTVLDQPLTDDEKLKVSLSLIETMVTDKFRNAKSRLIRTNLLIDDVSKKIKELNDIMVFIITVELVMLPINRALATIPSNDRIYCEQFAQAYLDGLGIQGLATVINLWDDLGVVGCLNAERSAVVQEFSALNYQLESLNLQADETELNMIRTAFIQEFERRLSQKRKGRAGGSLEDVMSFLFIYYRILAIPKPEHFQADIEVDKWFKCNDNWLIGISCKRTLRERWKQVSSADRGNLSKHKIKEIWHIITYDEDLSDDKLTMLGQQGQVFYLSDDSRKLKHAKQHLGMKAYVRPITQLIEDIKREQQR